MTGSKFSRRQFVQVVLGTSALVSLAHGQTATFELGGQVSGWLGQSPGPIEDETNPTLQMKAGKEYVIAWKNLDGNSHNVAIGDGKGNVLERTEVVDTKGATQTLEFTATRKMKSYFSEFDPETMRGKLEIVQPTTTTNGTANGTTTGTTGTTPSPKTTGATSSPGSSSKATTETTTGSTGNSPSSTTDGGGSAGFGWLAALGSVAGLGYLLRRSE